MSKRILIVDDSESTTMALSLLFDGFGFVPLNSRPVIDKEEISQMIAHLMPDIIFLDHDLGTCNTGFDIVEIIPKNILILSTSILVSSSRELTDSYRNVGVWHFPGKTFSKITNCIEGNCGCYLPASSQLRKL